MHHFTISKTDLLSANSCSEISTDALSLANYETFFLIEPHKYPFIHYFSKILFLIRNSENYFYLFIFKLQLNNWKGETGTSLVSWHSYFAPGFYFSHFTSPLLPRFIDHSGTKSSQQQPKCILWSQEALKDSTVLKSLVFFSSLL